MQPVDLNPYPGSPTASCQAPRETLTYCRVTVRGKEAPGLFRHLGA